MAKLDPTHLDRSATTCSGVSAAVARRADLGGARWDDVFAEKKFRTVRDT